MDIDFNTLDTTINLQTWVMVLEFFGIGVQKPPSSQPVSPVSSMGPEDWANVSVVDEHSIVGKISLIVSNPNLYDVESHSSPYNAHVSWLTTVGIFCGIPTVLIKAVH